LNALNTTTGGIGGAGFLSTITGERVFYAAGGGGGGSSRTSTGPLGGAPIAGKGSVNNNNPGGNATYNTGSGGGGGGCVDGVGTSSPGGNGGSGIVIIRYPQTLTPPTTVTGNVQIGYALGYQIYTWTSSGTVTF
jgi:hypothetical protein